MRNNIWYLILLVVSAAIFAVFICPFLHAHGLSWLCVIFYVIVVITFLYGRAASVKNPGRRL